MPSPDLLRRLDAVPAELAELRAEVAASLPPNLEEVPDEADDMADGNLLDTTAAAARFNYPRNTVTRWAREGAGVRRGGRWLVSVPRLRRRLNGGS